MTEISFRLGMLGVALQATGPETWIAPLSRAWSPWTPRDTIGSWRVRIAANTSLDAPAGPLFEAVPRCCGGLCTLAAPGFQGRIDAGQGAAYLQAHPQATPADAGYFLRVVMAVQAFTRGGVLFHAAGVVHRGQGYALFGLSGSGKTTAARLSAPDPVINDDLILLWPTLDGWQMHSTPFGKGRGDVHVAPLRAFLRLVKDSEVFVSPLQRSRALAELVANTPVLSGDVMWLPEVLSRWEASMAAMPVYALHFRRDSTFWEVVDAQLG